MPALITALIPATFHWTAHPAPSRPASAITTRRVRWPARSGYDLLDEPVWAALTTGNRALAEGGPLAKRYAPEVSPFAIANRSPEAWTALAGIVPPDGRLALTSTDALAAPPGLSIAMQAPILLPAAIRHTRPGPDYIMLGKADLPEMLDLAARTRPGPFGPRTTEFGRYIGIRADGVLAAMAGERMRFDRFVEISAVCVDPGHRGKGFAAFLVAELAQDLQARGMTPFLHVFESNAGAITLYEKLGFIKRRDLYVTSLHAVGQNSVADRNQNRGP